MALTIKTNKRPRHTCEREELPAKVSEDQFDYHTDGPFVRYRGHWYDVSEFLRPGPGAPFGDYWHGYQSDSAFSGVLIRLEPDSDAVIIGTYYS